jgi:NAD(P)-dependent dehydrogenase (short-subunit alcohol dehydrogenase family)
MKGIEGKVAIVTGGASGIGAAAVRRFVAEGAKVAIGDIVAERAEALAHELGGNAIPVQFDALDTDSVEALISKTADHFGRLDFLFNNAALMSIEANAKDSDPVNIEFEWWDRIMAGNCRGYLAGCKYAIPYMLERGRGSIVMTSSGSGILGDMSNIAYGASKAAVMSMARYIAVMYGKQGLRCNTVCPGLIRTEGGKQHVHGDILTIMENNTLTPRVGKPEDVAAMAVYLCSDDAEFITGQDIGVDGGITMHMPYYSDFNRMKVEWRNE